MGNLWRVFSYEVSRIIRRRSFLFVTFGLPLVLALASNVWQSLTPTPEEMMTQTAEVIDRFDGLQEAGFVDESGLFGVVPEGAPLTRFPDEASARAALEAGDIEAYYLIPADYAETGEARQILPTMTLDNVSREPLSVLTLAALESALPENLRARFEDPSNLEQVDLASILTPPTGEDADAPAELNRDADYLLMFIFTLLFLMIVFTGSGYMMQSVIEEKENKLVEILITSVRAEQLLTGKVLAQGIMSLFQVGVWFGLSALLLSFQGDFLRQAIPFLAAVSIPTESFGVMAAYLLLGFFMFAAAFGAVGALSNSSQEGSQYTSLFVLPAMIPYFMIGQLVADPNGPLAVGLSLFPLTAPITMIARSTMVAVPPLEVVLSLALMFGAVIGAFWLAGRLFRAQLMMSGKTPGPRAILRAIREG
ncbi:MAG: ABC transporter permease [Anaerolineae bacterium]|jgi:ABC-2 type transport system permease protein|nr:ABC transporter permease [Anaerolineae bacterium]